MNNNQEIWKSIKDYEGIYEVSNYGNVRSLTRKVYNYIKEGKAKEKTLHTHGYYKVSLYKNNKGKNHYVHRLVATAFIGDIPKNYHINHKDANKINNHISNLEIVTPRENILHARQLGLVPSVLGRKMERSKSGFANISPRMNRGTFFWNVCLRTKQKRYERSFHNIYEAIVYYNAVARANGVKEELLHKITQEHKELYGNGLCCLLK